jgi:hypothetical protein
MPEALKLESPYLTPAEAAEWLRMAETYLAKLRERERGPVYYQPGGKGTKVLYKVADLETWVESGKAEKDADEIPREV